MSSVDDLPVVTEPTEARLNQRQLVDYRAHREDYLDWLLTFGRRPSHAEGYAYATVENYSYRTDQFYRWVGTEEDCYTTNVTHEHADGWMHELARQDKSNAHRANSQKAVKALFKWRHHNHGLDEWEPTITFSESTGTSNPRDYVTMNERQQLRAASLEYGSIPSYSDISPEERDRWKAHLAQRFEKPKSEVTPTDWERANGWKIPSLTWVSLDAGLRPIEVERAVLGWIDLGNEVLRIPKEESSKNAENWVVSLQSRTTEFLRRWLEERKQYEMYTGTDAIWLTREGNPYSSTSLRYVLGKLCESVGIDTRNRSLSWYALRHSTGTYMTREEDLAAAQAQLRHKSEQTTMRYDQAPVEDRRDALDRMG